jgi:hypothetical protein
MHPGLVWQASTDQARTAVARANRRRYARRASKASRLSGPHANGHYAGSRVWRKSHAARRRGLPGIDGMLDSSHLGAAFGPGAAFLCRRRAACATALHCCWFSRWYSIETAPAAPSRIPLRFSWYVQEFSGFRPDCPSMQTKRRPGRLRAIRRPWGRVYKSTTLPELAGKQGGLCKTPREDDQEAL